MSDAGTFDYVIAGGGTAGCVLAARLSRGPGRDGVPGRGRAVRRRRRQHPGAVGVDASAGLRLRLGLSRRTAGAGQLVHAARPRQGARRVLVAQLVHRVLAARRMPRRVGGDGRRRVERRRGAAAGRQRARPRRCCCATSRPTILAVQRFSRPRRWSGCRPWRSTAARRCATGPAGSRSTRPRTAPACRPRTRTCIRSWAPARTSRCAPIAGSPRSCSTSRCDATGVRYQRPDLTGYDVVSARREVDRHRRRHRHPEVVDAVRNRAGASICGSSASTSASTPLASDRTSTTTSRGWCSGRRRGRW